MMLMEREMILVIVRRRCENQRTDSEMSVHSGAVAIGEVEESSMRP